MAIAHRASERVELRHQWDEEYTRLQSIPSSSRDKPSHALVELVDRGEVKGAHGLDLGCGNGRNAWFLASLGMSVTAIDFSGVALGMLRTGNKSSLTSRIAAIKGDFYDGLPFKDASFDIVLDSYSLCHVVDLQANAKVMAECRRILRPNGQLLKIHLDDRDEYYLQRIHKRTAFGHISYDPVNGFSKLHCSAESYYRFFSEGFKMRRSYEVRFADTVRGRIYERSVIALVMEKQG